MAKPRPATERLPESDSPEQQIKRLTRRLRTRKKEATNLKLLVEHLLAERPGPRLMPPPELRLHVGRVSDEANFWRQGFDSSRRVMELFGTRPSGLVLDWGCGSGRTLNWLGYHAGWRKHYRGCDVDPAAIAYLRGEGVDQVEVCADQPPLPYAANTFEGLFCFSVLTHIHPRFHRGWYEEIHRVLKPGGRAILTVHSDANIVESPSFADEEKEVYRTEGWIFSEREGHYKHAATVAKAFTLDRLAGLFEIVDYRDGGYHAMDDIVVRKPRAARR